MPAWFSRASCVILGGGLGAYARYLVHASVQGKMGTEFPYGTLLINISGAFLIGLLMMVLTHRMADPFHWRLFLVVGILGGYTTFSSLCWEAYALIAANHVTSGLVYILASAIGGGVAVVLGVLVGRAL